MTPELKTEEKTNPIEAVEITPEQIEKWKKTYGKVFLVTTEDGKKCYLRRPDRKMLSASAVLSGGDLLKRAEILTRNCWLGGDMDIQNQDKYFLGLSLHIDDIVEIVQAEIKEV